MSSNNAGLAGISAGETALSTVGKSGVGLTYVGYDIHDLAEKCSFEETAYLLLNQKLPNSSELSNFKKEVFKLCALPQELSTALELLPSSAHPMDVLRTGVSVLGCLEPEKEACELNVAQRIIATLPGIIAYWYHFHHSKKKIDTSCHSESLAEHFLCLLYQATPTILSTRVIDASMTLYAEHEFNASTFTARVCAATLSDIYSCITGAIGTLRGPLHGGANEQAMAMMDKFSSAESAKEGVAQLLKSKAKIMGFGHRVYKDSDPRSDIVKGLAFQVAKEKNETAFFEKFEVVEQLMRDEKNLFPNLDFYAAALYRMLDIPTDIFTPIFVMARSAGWLAHVFEQRKNNRLIRPNADYVGPDARSFVEISER